MIIIDDIGNDDSFEMNNLTSYIFTQIHLYFYYSQLVRAEFLIDSKVVPYLIQNLVLWFH